MPVSCVVSKRSRRRQGDVSVVDATSPPSMLVRACHLIRHFPEYLEVVVSVARKTDGRHWADLFAAAGVSTDLFEECFERRQYRTATCYILVIEKLEGPGVGQQCALRLLQVTLEAAMYELAGELVRFLLRSGRESSSGMGREEEGLLHSLFHLTFTPSSANATQNALHGTVAAILGAHAQQLLARRELREVVGFVKGTHFDLTVRGGRGLGGGGPRAAGSLLVCFMVFGAGVPPIPARHSAAFGRLPHRPQDCAPQGTAVPRP